MKRKQISDPVWQCVTSERAEDPDWTSGGGLGVFTPVGDHWLNQRAKKK